MIHMHHCKQIPGTIQTSHPLINTSVCKYGKKNIHFPVVTHTPRVKHAISQRDKLLKEKGHLFISIKSQHNGNQNVLLRAMPVSQ